MLYLTTKNKMNFALSISFQKMIILFVVGLKFCGSLAGLSCPKYVFVERENDSTIVCQAKGILTADVYWYKGSTSLSSPILRLEKGKPGGSDYNKGHFDITSHGSLIIRNATLDDEAVYTLVVFYQNKTSEKAKVALNITVTPHPPCLEVTNCPLCRECILNVTDSLSGQLMCSVAGSRPQIKLDWIIKSQKGLGIAIHGPVKIHDSYTDSWSTVVNVSYASNGCGEEAILQCVAKEDYGLLAISQSQVRLFTDTCEDDVTEPAKIGIIVIVPALFVVVVLIVLFIYFIHKGKPSPGHTSTSEDISDHHQLTQVKELPFISRFKEVYQKECRMNFLPWEDSVPVDILYADCQCDLTFPNGDKVTFSSDKVLTGPYIRSEKRVLIVGDAGYGKTMFAMRFVQHWIEETSEEYYIFFLSLKGVTENMKVSDILKNKICKETKVKSEDIEDLIKEYKCVFLLDGLHEMYCARQSNITSIQDESVSQSDDTTSGSTGDLKVSIKELLTGTLNDKYKNVQVWVTSLDIADVDSLFPKRNLKVKLNGFSESKLREYIKRTCSFYASQESLADTCETPVEMEQAEEPAKGNSDTNNIANTSRPEKRKIETENGLHPREGTLPIARKFDTSSESLPLMHDYDTYSEMSNIGTENNNAFEIVWGLMDKIDIFDIFRTTPHFLILTIHVLSRKFARMLSPLSKVSINNTATIIDIVITCLKDKYTKDSKRTYPLEEFNKLKEKLGEMAIQTTQLTDKSDFERVSLQDNNTDQVKTGLAMGVLKDFHSQNTCGTGNANTTSPGGLKFSHYIFQDYFAAYYFLKNPGYLQKKIESLEQDKQDHLLGYLKFSSLFPEQSFKHLCNALLKHKMYTHLFVCLHERGDENEIERIGRLLTTKAIVISCLAGRNQQKAVKVVLESCCVLGVKIAKICCTDIDALTFLKTLNLPQIECFELFHLTFLEEDFVLCLEWLFQIRNTPIVRFYECVTPLNMSSRSYQALEGLKKLNVKVEGLHLN